MSRRISSHLSEPGLAGRAAHLNNVFSSFMSWVNLSQGVWRLHPLPLNSANSMLAEKNPAPWKHLCFNKHYKRISPRRRALLLSSLFSLRPSSVPHRDERYLVSSRNLGARGLSVLLGCYSAALIPSDLAVLSAARWPEQWTIVRRETAGRFPLTS